MSTKPSGVSITHSVYHHLRAELLNGRLPPGEKLKLAELCATLAVSLSAVREALSRLTAEGLVIAEPQRGFRVAPIAVNELLDITNARIAIETLCLRRAIEVGDTEWEGQILLALHRLNNTAKHVAESEQITPGWAAAHAAFHLALVEACDSPWLLRIREMLYVQSERYRWFSVPPARGKRNLEKEHRRLADVTITRDADTACALITEHLKLTAEFSLKTGIRT
ncbi:FCD domain-containing protein [Paraburkholderia sediminicola]|uniref:GntR family transcriptional regulator n=1 Tax=Paraburkholderia sediminicola TaxID=458836 RepID=UPI0038BCE30E